MSATRGSKTVVATIGFAASEHGGAAYAFIGGSPQRPGALVRVAFPCRPLAALLGRDVAYAAVAAVAEELLRRGVHSVEFRVDDATLPLDLSERRSVPAALIVPYVTLRCTLNRFARATVASAGPVARDLTARARAEVSLHVAA